MRYAKLLLAAIATVALLTIGILSARAVRKPSVVVGEAAGPTQLPVRQASAACISEPDPIPNWTSSPPANCSVSWQRLGSDGDRSLYAGRYAWPSDASEPSLQRGYKVVTMVLYEGRANDDTVVPIWNNRLDESDESFRSVSLERAGPVAVVRVETCLNGTGGCGVALYRWRPGMLVDISADLRQQITRALPDGYSLYRFPDVNVRSMTISGGAWAKDDPACCPSSALTCSLKVADDKASAIDCRVTKNQDRR